MQRGVVGNAQIPAEPNHRGRSGHNFGSSAAEIAGTRKDFYFAFSEGKSGFLCRKNLSSVVPKKNFEKKTNSSCRIFCKRE
jgi:hypothetical protein